MLKMRLRPRLRPGSRWGSSRRSPDPLVGPTPLGACGASTLAPTAHASRRPPLVFFEKSNTVAGSCKHPINELTDAKAYLFHEPDNDRSDGIWI